MAKKISFNVQNHVFVPKHTLLNEGEKKELLKKYNITPSNLPRILKNDKALANMKVKEGDVIKIERSSQTAGKIDFYRLVVNE